MTKKCAGCGATLQFYNDALEGYVKEDIYETSTNCERCFRIKNYGDYKSVVKDNKTFINIIKSIDKKDLVVLVMDLFNLPENLDIITKNISNPILLVLTKRDLLPKIIYEDRLLAYVENYHLNYLDKLVVSSNKNYNFDKLIDEIKYHKTTNKVYVVGFTNAGKSTLINKLIYNYTDSVANITTSMLPSTTLNSIEIKFNDNMTLIDTPGLLSEGSIENVVDIKTLKKIVPKKEIRPITYQVKVEQWIVIEDLLKLNLKNNNITIFMSNTLNISRYFKDKPIENLKEIDIKIGRNEDLVINGLGFIKFTKPETIHLSLLPGVTYFTRISLV
ncbi:MAG: GTPase [Bacilli bacterium]